MKTLMWVLVCIVAVSAVTSGASRIKDIATVQGVKGQQLIGYGLVVGLNGSGDTYRSTFTVQSVASMLKRFGITVAQDDLRLRNVAAVMVTATAPAFSREGALIDVTVSSLGDASSLQGGTLLLTPLSGPDGVVYGLAQGPVSVGGLSVRAGGSEIRKNHTGAGRVPGGGQLERPVQTVGGADSVTAIVLSQADYTTAARVVESINTKFNQSIARAVDAASISVSVPQNFRGDGKFVAFISAIELLEVTPDAAAKVVINERTGTIVIGGNVTILPVAISHGGVNIEIQSTPVISQPGPFSKGETVVTNLTTLSAGEDTASVVALNGATTVQEVARALNALKVAPRDIIAIFQALRQAEALKAELEII
jgi:flagellar P-ring protein FlgI